MSTGTKPEFTSKEKKELEILKEYVKKLGELEASLKAEFPNSAKATIEVTLAIESASKKIASLEIRRIHSELPGEVLA